MNAAQPSTFPNALPRTSPVSSTGPPASAERVLHGDGREAGRPVQAPAPHRVEVRVGIDGCAGVVAALDDRPRSASVPTQPARPEDSRRGDDGTMHRHVGARRCPLRAPGRPGPGPCPSRRSRRRWRRPHGRAGPRDRRAGTCTSGSAGSGSSRPAVGTRVRRATTSAVMAASIAPAAPSVCPICALLLETGTREASAPRARAMRRGLRRSRSPACPCRGRST